MRSRRTWIRRILVNGILLGSLVGVLIAYAVIVRELPQRIYTTPQQEYISYNTYRDISQTGPTLNTVSPDGAIGPAILPGGKNRIRATLQARYEEWRGVRVTVYDLDFQGTYQLVHTDPQTATIQIWFPFPDNLETLHNVHFLVDGTEPDGVGYSTQGILWQTVVSQGAEHQIEVRYQATGANSFRYSLPHEQRSDVDIIVTIMGLSGSEVPREALPSTKSELIEGGETFAWDYSALIADRNVQIDLPQSLSFAQRVAQLQDDFRLLSQLAPILVGLFLACLAGILHLGGLRLGLEGYFLVGCGLAMFYPTLTFLSGLIDLVPATALTLSCVSLFLLVFLGLQVGWRQSWWRVGLLLIVFLGFGSLGMLTPWRGLFLSGGGLLLVGTLMLLYALQPKRPQPEPETEPESTPVATPAESEPNPEERYCPHCGRFLREEDSYCPGCGHDTSSLRRCAHCGQEQFVPTEIANAHCLHCGQSLR